MKYPTTYLKEILDAIGGVISGGKVQVDTEITATIDPGNLATEASLAALLAKTAPGRNLGTGGDVLDVNSTGDRSTQLAVGLWRLCATRDLWYKQGAVTVTAVKDTAGSAFLAAGGVAMIPVTTEDVDDYVHVIKGEDETDGKASLTLEE